MKCPYCHKKTADEAKLCVHCGKDVQKFRSRNQDAPISCPTCHRQTTVINFGNTKLDFCGKCSGIWFDKKEMREFQATLEDENLFTEFIQLLDDLAPSAVSGPRPAYIQCPICHQVMHHHNFHDLSGIILDKCSDHGTWAEKHDLEKIIDLISSGNIEDILKKASRRRYENLEKKVMAIESYQLHLKTEIQRARNFSKTHFILDLFGII